MNVRPGRFEGIIAAVAFLVKMHAVPSRRQPTCIDAQQHT